MRFSILTSISLVVFATKGQILSTSALREFAPSVEASKTRLIESVNWVFNPPQVDRLYIQSRTLDLTISLNVTTSSIIDLKLFLNNGSVEKPVESIKRPELSGEYITCGENPDAQPVISIHSDALIARANGGVWHITASLQGGSLEDSPRFAIASSPDGAPTASLSDSTDLNSSDNNATSPKSTSKDSDGGIAVGAIVGIAIGAFVAVVAILALVWFIMRRRKRSNMSSHPDATTPLATGYHNTTAGRSGDFVGEKETGPMAIAESPRSQMYTDQPDPRSSQVAALATGAAGTGVGEAGFTESGRQIYDASSTSVPGADHQAPPPPRENSSSAGMDSPVPSTTVARHLVDPDMTEDDIRRLEEEELELDRQIQEARRK